MASQSWWRRQERQQLVEPPEPTSDSKQLNQHNNNNKTPHPKQQQQQQDEEEETKNDNLNSNAYETLSLADPALLVGRVLAQNVVMPEPGYPPYPVSLMDGYCYSCPFSNDDNSSNDNTTNDLSSKRGSRSTTPTQTDSATTTTSPHCTHGITHAVIGHARVVNATTLNSSSSPYPATRSVAPVVEYWDDAVYGRLPTALSIVTGAPLVPPYNAVIPLEDCVFVASSLTQPQSVAEKENEENPTNKTDATTTTTTRTTPSILLGYLSIPHKSQDSCKPTHFNRWIRPVGSDIAAHTQVLRQGHLLTPLSLGLLAQCRWTFSIPVQPQQPSQSKDKTGGGGPPPRQSLSLPSTRRRRRVLHIGLVSTGNELVNVQSSQWSATASLLSNASMMMTIPDVNRLVLQALLQQHFADQIQIHDLGIVREEEDEVEGSIETAMAKCLEKASTYCDVIVTSGGISKGRTDCIAHLLHNNAEWRHKHHVHILLQTLHMKPGKPTTVFTLPRGGGDNNSNSRRRCLVFALPGNPVSAWVCAQLLVLPSLQLVFDLEEEEEENDDDTIHNKRDDIIQWKARVLPQARVHTELEAVWTHAVPMDSERPEYHRVRISWDPQQKVYQATSTGVQRSSRLISVLDSDGVALVPQASTTTVQQQPPPVIATGTVCTVLLWWNHSLSTRPCKTSSFTVATTTTTVDTSRHLSPSSLVYPKEPSSSHHTRPSSVSVTVVELVATSHSSVPTAATPNLVQRVSNSLNPFKSDISSKPFHVASHHVLGLNDLQPRQEEEEVALNSWPAIVDSTQGSMRHTDLLLVVTNVESFGQPQQQQQTTDNNNNKNSDNAFSLHSRLAHELVTRARTTTTAQHDKKSNSESPRSNTRTTTTTTRMVVDHWAPALADQLRRGAATATHGTAALWEVVVASLQIEVSDADSSFQKRCCVVVFLSNQGLEEALRQNHVPLRHACAVGQSPHLVESMTQVREDDDKSGIKQMKK